MSGPGHDRERPDGEHADGEHAEQQVARHVRRTVGLKVLRDLNRWAEGVHDEQRQRPRLVGLLLALIAAVIVAAALLAWSYYRGF